MTFFSLGDLMVDVVARLFGPLAEGSDSPGVISYVGGGSAANTAAWLTRVAETAVFVGAIGDDPAGQAQVESLRANVALVRANARLAAEVATTHAAARSEP